MPVRAQGPLKPRKVPRQARAVATVEAIFTGTIQVLLKVGASQLTTTRVAARAGVSVGTLYQYFPHKRALLYALLRQHLEGIAQTMERASTRLADKPLNVISDGIVSAWLEAKTKDIAVSRALYAVSADFDINDLLGKGSQRIQAALERLLTSTMDATFEDPRAVAFTLRAVLGGSVRSVLERNTPEPSLALLSGELPRLCRSYLHASAMPIGRTRRRHVASERNEDLN